MVLDQQLVLSDQQAVTVTAPSTNVVKVPVGNLELAAGEELWLLVKSIEAVTADGAATVSVDLQTDDNEAFTSKTTIATTGALAKSVFTAGANVVKLRIPLGVEKYLRVVYTVATGPLTAGTFTDAITKDANTFRTYSPSHRVFA